MIFLYIWVEFGKIGGKNLKMIHLHKCNSNYVGEWLYKFN